MKRRYLFKLYPTAAQAAALHEQRKMMADLWNALKQRREDVYRRESRSLSFFNLTDEITEMRHECPEWRAVPAITAHRVAKRLTDAYAAFFRRLKAGEAPGYPQWHARERETTIPLGTMSTTGWRVEQRQDNPFSWRLHYGSVTNVRDPATWIHARGRMPDDPLADEARGAGAVFASHRHRRATNRVPIEDWRNADIIWRDGRWWLSVCVEIAARRDNSESVGVSPLHIRFDLIDDFVRVNGRAETPEGLIWARQLQDDRDALQSDIDLRWPRGKRRSDAEQEAFAEARAEVAALSARIARIRKNALHVWTARVVRQASEIAIVAPPLRENTRSPRGSERSWGANVEVVSGLNRNTLAQAPGMAIQMLRYKAEEKGIRCEVVTDAAPKIAVGGELVKAGKTLRRGRRVIRKEAA